MLNDYVANPIYTMRPRIGCGCRCCLLQQLQSVLAIFTLCQLDSAWLDALQWKANNLYIIICSRIRDIAGAQNLINYILSTVPPILCHYPDSQHQMTLQHHHMWRTETYPRGRLFIYVFYLFLFRLIAHERTHTQTNISLSECRWAKIHIYTLRRWAEGEYLCENTLTENLRNFTFLDFIWWRTKPTTIILNNCDGTVAPVENKTKSLRGKIRNAEAFVWAARLRCVEVHEYLSKWVNNFRYREHTAFFVRSTSSLHLSAFLIHTQQTHTQTEMLVRTIWDARAARVCMWQW